MEYESARKSRPYWAVPGVWLGICGMFLCIARLGELKRQIPGANSDPLPPNSGSPPNWSEVIIVAPLAAAFLTTVIFTAARFGRRRFRVTEQGVGSDRHFFYFKQMSRAEWVDAGRCYVLKLTLNELPARLYGVPDLQTRTRIESLLRERGIESKPHDRTVKSLLTGVGGGTAIYKFMIGIFMGMTIWCLGLCVSMTLLVGDLKILKANADNLIAKYDLVREQLRTAGLPTGNLKNIGKAEYSLMKESGERLMRMHLISAGLWSASCFVTGFFLMRSVANKKKNAAVPATQNETVGLSGS